MLARTRPAGSPDADVRYIAELNTADYPKGALKAAQFKLAGETSFKSVNVLTGLQYADAVDKYAISAVMSICTEEASNKRCFQGRVRRTSGPSVSKITKGGQT